jgi:hypothetical protein
MTDPFAAIDRYQRLAETYAGQLRLPIYPLPHLAGHEPARDRDGTRSAETACPAPVPQDCQARAEGIAGKDPA